MFCRKIYGLDRVLQGTHLLVHFYLFFAKRELGRVLYLSYQRHLALDKDSKSFSSFCLNPCFELALGNHDGDEADRTLNRDLFVELILCKFLFCKVDHFKDNYICLDVENICEQEMYPCG